MKILLQIAIVFALCLAGECISAVLPFTLPGSIVSMILLFILLLVKLLKVRHIETKTAFLQQNMAFFFVPASVSILEHIPLLRSILLPFILICTVSTILTFTATAAAVSLCLRIMNAGNERRQSPETEGKS
ncbi:CidA/LrgA family protein [Treponema brennaborense]|uniref:LrgA family protein n=1 Tax=Treponema brennaborense (strain DSM 12168 / CIP 105900 / DD5/3) TaxID=906968 RepID=F4LPE4_TREBD|nr:CidA/LrgA family protein [Treponema brennaborense]AEE15955.1 LrgA family protein [Treponema brennaborense DSM 12168]